MLFDCDFRVRGSSTLAAGCFVLLCGPAIGMGAANTLRIVNYNVNADTTDSDSINNATALQVETVLDAIGNESLNGNAQPIDVLALTELQGETNAISPTLVTLTNDLNAVYGSGTYAYDTVQDTTDGITETGNGPSGLIYNTKTVVDVGATIVAAPSSGSDPRSPMLYTLQAKGDGAASQFYLYVDHYKADQSASDASTRTNESVIVRESADSLGANAHIIYSGDFNLAGGTNSTTTSGGAEQAYKNLTAAAGANLINGSGSVVGTAGTGQGTDPLDPGTFTNDNAAYEYLNTESDTDLTARFDLQLVSNAAKSSSGVAGLQLVPDTQTAFGNNTWKNGVNTTSLVYTTNPNSTAAVTYAGNTALADLAGMTDPLNPSDPNYRSTVLSDLTDLSDHLPFVADYTIAVPEPATGFMLLGGLGLLAGRGRRRPTSS